MKLVLHHARQIFGTEGRCNKKTFLCFFLTPHPMLCHTTSQHLTLLSILFLVIVIRAL